jgi:hypothetical protein
VGQRITAALGAPSLRAMWRPTRERDDPALTPGAVKGPVVWPADDGGFGAR